MCGRYTYKLTWEDIVRLYRLTLPDGPPEKLKASEKRGADRRRATAASY